MMDTHTSPQHDHVKKGHPNAKIKPLHFFLGFLGISFLAAFVIGGVILGRNKANKQSETKEQVKLNSDGLPASLDEWQTYSLNTLDMQISLPENLAKEGKWKEQINSASEKGSIICFSNEDSESSVCSGKILFAGGTSTDFQEGREGTFTDLQGFSKEGNKYLIKTTGGNKFVLTNAKFREINNKNGVKIIKVLGENQTSGGDFPVAGTPGEGYLGAIVNTNHPKFTGIAIQLKLDEGISEYEFDQILESIKFTN